MMVDASSFGRLVSASLVPGRASLAVLLDSVRLAVSFSPSSIEILRLLATVDIMTAEFAGVV